MWEHLVETLDDDVRARLSEIMTTRRTAKGDSLFVEGDPGDALHVIDSGHVLVERVTLQGDRVAVALRGPGDLMGEQALITDEVRGATALAVTPLVTRVLSRKEFERLRVELPKLNDLLVRMLDARVREAGNLLLEARHHPAELRVRRRLSELSTLFGEDIPLTQATVAALAGTTRPTTNAALRDLEAEGILRLRRGGIVMIDADRLHAGDLDA